MKPVKPKSLIIRERHIEIFEVTGKRHSATGETSVIPVSAAKMAAFHAAARERCPPVGAARRDASPHRGNGTLAASDDG